jgi:protein-S-isoprenylcysteine O-methyltransferase Ste14
MSPALKTILATAAFALLHSALASRSAKRWAALAAGERNAQMFYRPFYVVQGVLTSVALAGYGLRLPRRTLYRLTGARASIMRGAQAVSAWQLVRGIRAVGFARLTGMDAVRAARAGTPLPEPPVAQGPERDASGTLRAGGPFRHSRHPLNFWAVPLFWCTPHLTTRRLAFNVAAAAYLALGSLHEEARLRAAYGSAYRRYASQGPAFFVPRIPLPRSLHAYRALRLRV